MATSKSPSTTPAVCESLEPRLLLSTGPVLEELSFAAGGVITTEVTSIAATFDRPLAPDGVHGDTVRLRNVGADGQFGTDDDTFAIPQALSLSAGDTRIEMAFDSPLPDGTYRLEILGMQELLVAGSYKANGLIGLNASTGRPFAPTEAVLPAICDIALGDGALYLLSSGWNDGSHRHVIYSMDLATGEVSALGMVSLPTGEYTHYGDNIDYDPVTGLLYVSASHPDNTVVAFDPATGMQQAAEVGTGVVSFGTTLWVDDHLYVLGSSPTDMAGMYSWQPGGAGMSWVGLAQLPGGNWSGSFANDWKATDALAYDLAADVLYAGTADKYGEGFNKLVALDRATGMQLSWIRRPSPR